MSDLTLTPKASGTYWGTAVADIQSGLSVSGGDITGTLKYYDDATKALVHDWGEGYFIAVGFSNYSSGLTYSNVKVGLYNSAGTGLLTLDSDQDAVMHITDPVNQKIMAVQKDPVTGAERVQYWNLDKLTYEPKGAT